MNTTTQNEIIQIAVPSSEYTAMQPYWKMVDALWGGTATMRDAGEAYLPKYDIESSSDYEARKNATVLLNIFRQAVVTAVGKVFKKQIVLQQKDKPVSEDLQAWIENIDGNGNNLNVFAKNLFQDVLKRGLSHFMVDMTQSSKAMTRAEQKQRNERPYWVQIEAPEIIGWRHKTENGITTLTQIRRRYSVKEPDGLFGEAILNRVAVYEPGIYQIYQQGADNNWNLIDEGTTGIDYIPLVTVYSDRTGFMQAVPAFLNLAYKNIEHWQSSSDKRLVFRRARFAILCP